MIDPNAEAINKRIENTVVYRALSDLGKRAFMPNGITVQSNNAKEKATRFNATVGIATQGGSPMSLAEVRKYFSPSLTSTEIFAYSAGLGNPKLRAAWKADMQYKNPSLSAVTSNPIVTAGLTDALFIASSLFIGKNDSVVLPDMYWENYDLILDYHPQSKVKKFPFYSGKGFNVKVFKSALTKAKGNKVVCVLNFPNNPTGYTPTKDEAQKICDAICAVADSGKDVVAIFDDAYYSLFYEKDTYTESLFSLLANARENILAIKCDAATKECEVWGFRIGFITFGFKGATQDDYKVLESKVSGIIRGSVSNCSTPAQNILLHLLTDGVDKYRDQKAEAIGVIKKRYKLFKLELTKYRNLFDLLKPLTFNSGYFMSFKVKDDRADDLRDALLNEDKVGVIALFGSYIRVAFSSLDEEKIPEFLQVLYNRASALLSD